MGEPFCSCTRNHGMTQDLHGFLNPNDPVAISFWIISISMVAATTFFLMESIGVAREWGTSLNVGALVTLVAAVHYFYMREFWITIGTSPILYRYIKWSSSTSFSPQSSPTLEQECSSACLWEHVRCWLSVILARRISSTHGQDSYSVCLVGHSSSSKSSQVKLARNQLLWVAT